MIFEPWVWIFPANLIQADFFFKVQITRDRHAQIIIMFEFEDRMLGELMTDMSSLYTCSSDGARSFYSNPPLFMARLGIKYTSREGWQDETKTTAHPQSRLRRIIIAIVCYRTQRRRKILNFVNYKHECASTGCSDEMIILHAEVADWSIVLQLTVADNAHATLEVVDA